MENGRTNTASIPRSSIKVAACCQPRRRVPARKISAGFGQKVTTTLGTPKTAARDRVANQFPMAR